MAELLEGEAPLDRPKVALVGARSGSRIGVVVANLPAGPPADVAGGAPRRQGVEQRTGKAISFATHVPAVIAPSKKLALAGADIFLGAFEAYADGPGFTHADLPQVDAEALLSSAELEGQAAPTVAPAPASVAAAAAPEDEANKTSNVNKLLNAGISAKHEVGKVMQQLERLCHPSKKNQLDIKQAAESIKAGIKTTQESGMTALDNLGCSGFANLSPTVTLQSLVNAVAYQVKSVLATDEELHASGFTNKVLEMAKQRPNYDAYTGMTIVLECCSEHIAGLYTTLWPMRVQMEQVAAQKQACKA